MRAFTRTAAAHTNTIVPTVGQVVHTVTNRRDRIVVDVVDYSEYDLGLCVIHQAVRDGKAYGKKTVSGVESIVFP